MIAHPDFRLALARDRAGEREATAAGWRPARQARAAARPTATNNAATNNAAARLAGGFARLSERFRWLHFPRRKTTLTEAARTSPTSPAQSPEVAKGVT